MRFALTGSHGTGKSSVLNSLNEWLCERNITLINNSSSARHISKSGMSVNESGDDLVQLIVQSSHVQKFCKDRWITDRSVIDGWAYTEYLFRQEKVSHETLLITQNLMKKFLSLYDYLFYVPIEFPIEGDGIRNNNDHFQRDIDQIIFQGLSQYREMRNVLQLTGSIENRKNQITKILEGYLK